MDADKGFSLLEILDYIISFGCPVLMIYIGARVNAWFRAAEAREEKQRAVSKQKALCILAIGGTVRQVARTVKGEKVNGEMDASLQYLTACEHDLEQCLCDLIEK